MGSRIVDWIVDHPGLFFGGLLGALIGYVVHGSVGGRDREAAVGALEAAAPISAREIADVGRSNGVPRAVWEAAVDAAFAACGGDGVATPAEVSLLLRQALDAAEAAGGLASPRPLPPPSTPRGLLGEHHLRRAAAVLAAQAAAAGGAGAAPAGGGAVGAVEPPPSPLAAPPPATQEAPLLQLLSLYGTAMGGRAEGRAPPAQAPVADPPTHTATPPGEAFPSPSERAQMWLQLVRRGAGAGGAAASAGGGAPPAGMATREELVAVTRLLADTWQVPPRARVTQVGTWPFPSHAPRDAEDHVAAAIAEMKVDEERTRAEARAAEAAAKAAAAAAAGEAAPPPPPPQGGGAPAGGATFVDPGTLARCPAADADGRRLFSAWEVSRILLRSQAICAWNECYDR